MDHGGTQIISVGSDPMMFSAKERFVKKTISQKGFKQVKRLRNNYDICFIVDSRRRRRR